MSALTIGVLSRAGSLLRGATRRVDAALLRLARPDTIPGNERLRGIHSGQRAFVVGNGPSLKRQDLSALRGEILFTMNAFHKHPLCGDLSPDYHCLADSLYFDGSEWSLRFQEELLNTCGSRTIFLVPAEHVQNHPESLFVRSGRTVCVPFHPRQGVGDMESISPDLCGGLPWVVSVSQFAILSAIFMGCNPVYLLGLDHDFAAHRGTHEHFYQRDPGQDHPEVIDDFSMIPYLQVLEGMVTLTRGYVAIRHGAEALGVKVLNATDGGFLDVFQRVEFEQAVSDARIVNRGSGE